MYIGYTHKFSPNCVFTDGYNLDKALQDQQLVKRNKNKAQLKKELNYASPLFENKEIIEYPCDQATTTYRYFNKAMEFIGKNKKQPFFVYLTPSMPHVPLFVSPQFKGKSKRGLYGDAVEEIDWNEYYITEEHDNSIEVKESNRLTCNNIPGDNDHSRYNLINEMIISDTLSDETTLKSNIDEYKRLDAATKQLFKLI